jgi:hypothetical protein
MNIIGPSTQYFRIGQNALYGEYKRIAFYLSLKYRFDGPMVVANDRNM